MYYQSFTEMKTYDRSFWMYQTTVKPVTEWDLDKLEKWAHEYLIRSNKSKSKVLHLSQDNPRHRLEDERSVEKDLGVVAD